MINVFIVNGDPQSGKDTFVNFCLGYLHHKGFSMSTVDFVKEMAVNGGWDGVKTLEARKYLSELKGLLSEWLDTPLKEVKKKVEYINCLAEQYNLKEADFFLFVHCREPEEIDKLIEEFNAKTVFINRANHRITYSNKSDANVRNHSYDFVIENDGDLKKLQEKAKTFIYAFETKKNCPYCGHHIDSENAYCPICDKEIKSLIF